VSSYNQTAFVKDWVAVEVQFGRYSFIACDQFVKHMGLHAGNRIDLGVELRYQGHLSASYDACVAPAIWRWPCPADLDVPT